MCGIAGLISARVPAGEDLGEVARRMAERLRHRGPDDDGVWKDADAGVALSHRRLSIVDLSSAGHQPMLSGSGRYVLVFNGEIYNHLELRRELEREKWRGHSDTETLLAAIEAWGLERALQRSVGMFAVALWDRRERILRLARDRLGEKPLYYGLQGGALLFASELKAMRVCPAFQGEVDRQSLMLFLQRKAIPAPFSIYRGIFKLMPGTVLALSPADVAGGKLPAPRPYWSLRQVAEAGQRAGFAGSDDEAGDELERLLRQSIAGQMVADVPLGAFLSGGIDSSTVASLMQAQSDRPVQTFTIGFHEQGYNEAEHARAVAAHLGTEHTDLYASPAQALAVIPRLRELYDEPFADSSQIPVFLVSELARRHVSVSLSGDGGDELFGGYTRHRWAPAVWRRARRLPRGLRIALAGALTVMPPASWDDVFRRLDIFLPRSWRQANPGDKLHKLADVLAVRSPEEIYDAVAVHWKRPDDVIKVDAPPPVLPAGEDRDVALADLEHRMMYLDSISYLPDDILVKLDRAAMGVSLETRAPFLDHRVVEFAWRLPLSMKIRGGRGKWLLRRVLDRHVPRALIERPKMGFGVPLDAWLRGPLLGWAESLLHESRLSAEGFFHPEPVRNMWREHLSGKRNRSYHLWDILMFQAWYSAAGQK
jgi:asparagine synthase (glutamine-hydrolysing)